MIDLDTYKDIQGWLHDKEARALQVIAENARVAEIGCWKAKSSIAMAATAKSVISIDHFRGDAYAGAAFTLPEAVENIRKHDTENKISVLIQDFFGITDYVILESIMKSDVIYYDGDHSGESVRKLVKFLKLIDHDYMPVIAFHDYESSPVYQEGKDVFDAFVAYLQEYGYSPDCMLVIHRLAIIIPPRFRRALQERLEWLSND